MRMRVERACRARSARTGSRGTRPAGVFAVGLSPHPLGGQRAARRRTPCVGFRAMDVFPTADGDGLAARYLRRWWAPRSRNHMFWQLAYLWITLAAAVLWFTIVLVGLVLGMTLALMTVGIPILAVTF